MRALLAVPPPAGGEADPVAEARTLADGHDLAMRLRAAYLALHRRTNAELARFGLTADQFVVLTALADGDAHNQAELVARTGSDPNTLSEMLRRLERRGLVRRDRQARDRRALAVSLTPEGRQAQRDLWEASEPVRDRLRELLPDGALEALIEGLDRVTEGIAPGDDRPGVETPRSRSRSPSTS